jgi:hypothetical protein
MLECVVRFDVIAEIGRQMYYGIRTNTIRYSDAHQPAPVCVSEEGTLHIDCSQSAHRITRVRACANAAQFHYV